MKGETGGLVDRHRGNVGEFQLGIMSCMVGIALRAVHTRTCSQMRNWMIRMLGTYYPHVPHGVVLCTQISFRGQTHSICSVNMIHELEVGIPLSSSSGLKTFN